MKTSEERDLFPGALEVMILPTLERQPLHGYALAQHIKRTSNDLLQIEWRISSTNRRVRIYRLTKAGAKHLRPEVSTFEGMLGAITRVLAPGES